MAQFTMMLARSIALLSLVVQICAVRRMYATKEENEVVKTFLLFDNGEPEHGRTVSLTLRDCKDTTAEAQEEIAIEKLANYVRGHTMTLSQIICPQAHLPSDCKLFTDDGGAIEYCNDIAEGQHVFAVHPERFFVHNPWYVGYTRVLHRIKNEDANNTPVELETLSLSPRVFRVKNFFTLEDAQQLIANALSFTGDNGLHRSVTGPGSSAGVSKHRTSENVFDTYSDVSQKLQKRAFDLLGIHPFDSKMSDGLQILRYNVGQAYIHHMDYMDAGIDMTHDYDSANEGTNRFATILLYLSDVEEGGETVFTHTRRTIDGVVRTPNKREEMFETLKYIREKNLTEQFPDDSWETSLLYDCRTRLSVAPVKLEALLFYSQLPDGQADIMSEHGGCPVIQGEKWASNLWVWSGPRSGYGLQRNKETRKWERMDGLGSPNTPVYATFHVIPEHVEAELHWKDTNYGIITSDNPKRMTTYHGHVWQMVIDGYIINEWTIDTAMGSDLHFQITETDIRNKLPAGGGTSRVRVEENRIVQDGTVGEF